MTKKAKRVNSSPLQVMTTKAQLHSWQNKARTSGMTLREWVTRSLNSAPVLRIDVKPVTAEETR